ncbi:protein-glutamine gamma-glutamyltransferase [Peribacillus butanolivorans]|uniref:protein-glutamine gamma-glutamyltransferase n=1 Tax=Peribacillus butanolivorans TaxID=421767 RepID=UPI0036733BE0
MIKINQKWIDVSQIQPGIISEKALEILQLMWRYPNIFVYKTMEDLKFDIEMRLQVNKAAVSLDKSNPEFTILEDSVCNEQYWRLTKDGAFELKPRVLPHLALEDIFINGSLYAFECGTAIVIVFLKAVLDTVGPKNFDRLFSGLTLYDWHYPQNLILRFHEGKDYVPGDCVYFKNPDYDPSTPEWQGENAIFLGENLFYGHGIGITNQQGIIDELNSNRKWNAIISAFLTKHIISINSSHYSQFKPNIPRNNPVSLHDCLSNIIVSEIGSKTFLA